MYPISRPQRNNKVPFPREENWYLGFTLLELIFVMAILVFVATLAIPQYRKTFDSLQLQNLVYDIASFARYAQAKAIIDGRTNRLTFDTGRRVFRVESYEGIESTTEGPIEKWHLEKSKSMPDFVSIDLEDIEGCIKFYPDGTADKANIKITSSVGKNYIISIEQATGYVKFEELLQ